MIFVSCRQVCIITVHVIFHFSLRRKILITNCVVTSVRNECTHTNDQIIQGFLVNEYKNLRVFAIF